MELIQEFKKTTKNKFDCPWSDKKEIEFLQHYTKWLEAKINYTRCCTELVCERCESTKETEIICMDCLEELR